MRLTLLFLLLAGCWQTTAAQTSTPSASSAPAVPAPTARQLKLAEELLKTIYSDDSFNLLIEQAVTSQLNARPSLKPYEGIIRSFMRKYMSWESMRPLMAVAYAQEFTEAELLDITHYYQSPIGRKAAAKIPALMKAGAEIGQRTMQEHLPELTEAIQAKLNADKD